MKPILTLQGNPKDPRLCGKTFQNKKTFMSDKFNEIRRKTYLEHIRSGIGLTNAAYMVGCSPPSIHRYRAAHPSFQRLIDEAELESCAPIEDKLRELCLNGNLLAIFYFLGNRSGGRWRDVRRQEPKTEPILDNKTQRRLLESPEELQQQWIADAAK
jgi:hypothetical protein